MSWIGEEYGRQSIRNKRIKIEGIKLRLRNKNIRETYRSSDSLIGAGS